jgi:hypothetical protein
MDGNVIELGYAIFPRAPTLAAALSGPHADEALRLLAVAVRRSEPSAGTDTIGISEQSTPPDASALLVAVRQTGYGDELASAEEYWRAQYPSETVSSPEFTARNLAYITTFGFFGLIALLLLVSRFPQSEGTVNDQFRDVLLTMTGVVGAAWTGIISSFFGSSSDRAARTNPLAPFRRANQ